MIVSAVEYAKIRGRSPQWVSDQISLGMPAIGAGRKGRVVKIDTALAFDWELERIRSKYSEKRDRLANAQAERVELEVAVRKKQLAPVEMFESIAMTMATELTGALDGLAGRLANEFSGMTDATVIAHRLTEETNAIRQWLADRIAGLDKPAQDEPAAKAKPRPK